MNVEVVQRRLWKQSQQHRKHMYQPQRIATVCDRVLKRSNNQGSLESRMVGNLQVRFGVGAGVKFPGPHHVEDQGVEGAEMAAVCAQSFVRVTVWVLGRTDARRPDRPMQFR